MACLYIYRSIRHDPQVNLKITAFMEVFGKALTAERQLTWRMNS